MLVRRCALAVCLLLGFSPLAARAQGGPNAFTVSPVNPLTFGTVVAGMSKVIAPTATGAASFLITGPKKTQLTLTFTLPGALTLGGNALPITFGASTAAWSGTNLPASATFFDPATGAQIPMPDTRTLYVWIGGSLLVPGTQAEGAYTGTIVLSVVLN